ncbi:MAG: hydantoinase/oxoprolinase family protein [Candidatus Methanoplasma sp.]|jgi:N-methylhydantoinase A/oxoprolinase/acetone carboxylase beta subunit|nr:hydantoinase/oxoprolinase family protein [Candidatus Methanoplasma sp.]
MALGLGIDTGGTYTDAAIVDMGSGRPLRRAKAPTTREDLAVGVEGAMRGLGPDLLGEVSLVSLSSTLATNSIVEGRGCRVGLVCIGRAFDGSVPVEGHARVAGGHDVCGNEAEALDLGAVEAFMEAHADRVDCVAVTGYMSVRNPAHEIAAGEIAARYGKPVVCGHQLSSMLGFGERTVTAVMNARLIPVIRDLMGSVERAMSSMGIDAPLMVVKGDGSVMSAKAAGERPVETILSGPAASLTGALALTGEGDAIVVDVGGTTTDIGVLRGGRPDLSAEGATIGGRRTHVMAAEISTSGIGGDSRISVSGSKASLSPSRVIPLCMAASMWPGIMGDLEAMAGEARDMEMLAASKPADGPLPALDEALIALLRERPMPLRKAASALGVHPLRLGVDRMEERGLIQRIGLTPTDILHAEGSYSEHDARASELGVASACRRAGMERGEFIRSMKEAVVDKIAAEILRKVILDETGAYPADAVSADLVRKAATGSPGRDYSCSIRLSKPIVGMGAPADAWIPQAARRLGARYVSSEDSRVGNAIGAISGCISESVDVLIEPDGMMSGAGGPCTAYSKMGRARFESVAEAIGYAVREGGRRAAEAAAAAGAESVEVTHRVRERAFDADGARTVIDTTVTVTASGKPAMAEKAPRGRCDP